LHVEYIDVLILVKYITSKLSLDVLYYALIQYGLVSSSPSEIFKTLFVILKSMLSRQDAC
jgi:hypothetical protein